MLINKLVTRTINQSSWRKSQTRCGHLGHASCAYNNDNDLGYREVVTKLLTGECEAYGICLNVGID